MAKKKMTLEEKLEEAIVKDVPYEVPENWINTKLNSVVKFEKGKKPKTLIDNVENNSIPYVTIKYFQTKEAEQYTFETETNRLCNEEDILIVWDGARAGLIGTGVSGALGSTLCKVKYNNINNKYMFYYFLSKYDLINSNTKGTGIPHVDPTYLDTLILGIPPLKEQQRIVHRIESLFEKLDKSKELIKEARDGFEKRKQSLLEKAFRGELTREWRKKNKCEKGELKKIGDIAQLISGQHIASSDYNDEGTGIGYLTGPSDFNKIHPSITKWTNKPKVIAMNNDILITVKGSGVGSINILNKNNVCISRQLMALRPNEVNYYYIFWYLKYSYNSLQAMATGTAIPGLSRKDILELNIYCPKKDEEDQIVSILNTLFKNESKIEELTKLEEQIELIKKSILAKAFRGELGTNCEEDESALGLLKEILSKNL